MPTVDDISVTYDYSDQTTKIGTFDDQGQVINRLEINGFLEVESVALEQFNKTGAGALINDDVSDLRLTLVEASTIPLQVSDLGEGSDKFLGGSEFDLVSTGGGADFVSLGEGDDIVLVEGTVLKTDKTRMANANYVLADTGVGADTVEISTDFVGEVRLLSGGGDDTLVINADAASFSWGAGSGATKTT